MGKQKGWLGWVKRLFTSEPKDKNPKKWEWGLGRLMRKQCRPTITAPTGASFAEATAEQRRHALTVAIATAAAAEAAVAAAHAAAEVVKLTSASRSYSYLSEGNRSLAAIKIQSAYRAHLARKALRALKGVTRLQALIRGQAVRRTTKNFLGNRVEIPETSCNTTEEDNKNGRTKQFPNQTKLEDKELKLESRGQRTWECSLRSREDVEAIWLRKQEAVVKRERMRQYSFSQRERKVPQMVEESLNKDYRRERACDCDVLRRQDPPSNLMAMRKELQDEGLNSQILIPRKSFSHVNRSSVGVESCLPNSPVFPTYMAVTESSKAKVRSISTPRLRTGFLDTCSDHSEARNKEDISLLLSWHNHHQH